MNRAFDREEYVDKMAAGADGNNSMRVAIILSELVRFRCYWQYHNSDSSSKKEAINSLYRVLPQVQQRRIVGISFEPKLSARITEAPFPLAAR